MQRLAPTPFCAPQTQPGLTEQSSLQALETLVPFIPRSHIWAAEDVGRLRIGVSLAACSALTKAVDCHKYRTDLLCGLGSVE